MMACEQGFLCVTLAMSFRAVKLIKSGQHSKSDNSKTLKCLSYMEQWESDYMGTAPGRNL